MRRLLSIAALGLIATTSFMVPAEAQGYRTINGTQAQLQMRINAGVRSGALTRQEAFNLQKKLQRISQLEARFRMSGNQLSFRERNKLSNELSDLNRDIQRQLFDSDTRFRNRFGRRGF